MKEPARIVLMLCASCSLLGAAPPTDDPCSTFKQPWTAALKWQQVLDISTVAGADADAKLAAAQKELSAKGGGVVFFPAGDYKFKDSIKLMDGIILRGAPPTGELDARKDGYQPASKLEFPKYVFSASGDGTPIDTAFKSIELADPAKAANCGVVHLAINRGHIKFAEAEGFVCGKNRFIVGCLMRNAACADPGIPDAKVGQPAWQRYTYRFGAAIDAQSAENLLIANNRLSKSGEDNFPMNGFTVLNRKKEKTTMDGVVFDYDNRPGIYANHQNIGGAGGQGPDGTPEMFPQGFRKGVVVLGNYVYSTGRCAIGFTGDGTVCSENMIRFAKDVWRPSATGRDQTGGASTNDNRAMEIRGWRWTVANNDYEVYRNWAFDRSYYINDGEGLMHEDHANSIIKDSVLTGNKGNSYLSMYKTAGIDGLLVEGNDIRLASNAGGLPAIFVCSNRTNDAFPTRKVRIINNIVGGNGIIIDGSKESADNLIKGNRTEGPCYTKEGAYVITNQANAKVEGNTGFARVDDTPWMSNTERKAMGKAAKAAEDAKKPSK